MLKIISYIGNKIVQGIDWLITKANQLIIQLDFWCKKYIRHQKYISEIESITLDYQFEQVDINLINEVKKVLTFLAPDGIITKLKFMTIEQRVEYVSNILVPHIADIMGISYKKLVWIDNDSICGFYNYEDGFIALNPVYLATNDEKLLTIFVNTIIHECKHGRQFLAINGVELGYSKDLINKWKRNFEDYISPKESDEGYLKQPLEIDAFYFANQIIPDNKLFTK